MLRSQDLTNVVEHFEAGFDIKKNSTLQRIKGYYISIYIIYMCPFVPLYFILYTWLKNKKG